MRKFFVVTVITLSSILFFGNVFAASDVENRVTILEGKVNTLEGQVAILIDTVAIQQTAIQNLLTSLQEVKDRVVILEANPSVKIGELGYMRLDTNELNGVIGPHVIFEGVNLHLQNGSGGSFGEGFISDNPPNGLGNLIIGYDGVYRYESRPLEPGDRRGSHNVVIGNGNAFSGISSIVQGWCNIVRGQYSAAIAGDNNEAGGWSAVIGGWYNIAAEGAESVIIGGYQNQSTGTGSVITGGHENIANGHSAVVSGGVNNSASGNASTISGGQNNSATGNWSSVSGGFERQAIGDHDWAAGSLWENY